MEWRNLNFRQAWNGGASTSATRGVEEATVCSILELTQHLTKFENPTTKKSPTPHVAEVVRFMLMMIAMMMHFDFQPSHVDLQPSHFDRRDSSFDLGVSSVARKPSSFELRPSRIDLRFSTFGRRPSSFELGASSFNRRPSTFDLRTSTVAR